MKTVFLSHAGDDAAAAKTLEQLIAFYDYQSWRFQRNMLGANAADPQLPANIEESDIFLFCISDHSQRSDTCQKEFQHAALLQKPLVTVRLNRETDVPTPMNDHQWVDFDDSQESAVKLIKALQNAVAFRWNEIPSDWTTWDGKSKSELSVTEDRKREIPLPRIRSKLTDMEKQDFLSKAFAEVRSYFGQALDAIETTDARVNTRISDESNFAFKCQVFHNGDIKKACMIWISDNLGLNGIAYQEAHGRMSFYGRNSYNELGHVIDHEGIPALEFPSGLGMFGNFDDCRICTVDGAAACLWRYFIRDMDESSMYW